MSTKKRRAAFDPNLLGDLADVLPPVGAPTTPTTESHTVTDAQTLLDNEPAERGGSTDRNEPPGLLSASRVLATNEPADPRSHVADIEQPLGPVTSDNDRGVRRRPDARRKNTKKDAASSSTRIAPPEVALPQEIYTALRALTLDERASNPATARSYGQVVLDAVEEGAATLQTRWSRQTETQGTGLFKRAESGRPTRRRHSEPRARVPLAGIINADAAVLDQLASDWGAGSRSALVEEALRLYLGADISA